MFEGQSGSVLLDCGCGNGKFTQQIMGKIKDCREVHGIELIEGYCEEAKKRGLIVHQDDLNKGLALENESIDVVFSNQVIEHLYETDKFISEIYRILKHGGYAVISTENLSSWHNIFALILGWQPFSLSNISYLRTSVGNVFGLQRKKENDSLTMGTPKSMQHMRIFTPLGLKEIFEIHGFRCERLLGAGYYPLPRFLAKFMAKLDVRHTAFLVLKIRKPIFEGDKK
jgi:SAM-dependent methyltransferase